MTTEEFIYRMEKLGFQCKEENEFLKVYSDAIFICSIDMGRRFQFSLGQGMYYRFSEEVVQYIYELTCLFAFEPVDMR